MTFTTIEDTATPLLERFAEDLSGGVKTKCQNAAAFEFASIASRNFGFGGADRPEPWPILSYDYAKEFHDGQRIPTLQLTGALQESIVINSTPDEAVVTAESDYASDHQFGDESRNLPARPFFPMDENEAITPQSETEVMAAAQEELDRIMEAFA